MTLLLALPTASRASVSLDDVLDSVAAHYPMLRALDAEQAARREALRSARGAFDARLGLRGEIQPEGFYERRTAGATLDVPTRLWGARLFGGYRVGRGDAPSYEGDELTDEAGEVRAGLELPLLRGGPIDPERARISRAELSLERMSPELALERIDLFREATTRYWDWLATGFALEIAERLLAIADDRQSQIAGRVERGAEPRIDLSDNARLIVEREVGLRGAVRDFEQAAIRLSLFHRDATGRPLRPSRGQLPADFPLEVPLLEEQIERDLEAARRQHPLIRRFDLDQESLEVDLALARNDVLPRLGLRLEGSRDFGESKPGIDQTGRLSIDSRSETQVKAQLRLEFPVQQRGARGRIGIATARLARLEARRQLALEQVVAQALLSVEALEAAFAQTERARENVRLARLLRDAEARRFELGLGNLIDVNIRELQAATAERQLIEAQATYFRALADYRARIGVAP